MIVSSASTNSSNLHIAQYMQALLSEQGEVTVFESLHSLPHFNTELAIANPPAKVKAFRELVQQSTGIVICTPEYIFSIPSVLKNAFEWCVSTTVFEAKPMAIITASAQGEHAHSELQLIAKTVMAQFNEHTTLLIQGVRGKFNEAGELTNAETAHQLKGVAKAFINLMQQKTQ